MISEDLAQRLLVRVKADGVLFERLLDLCERQLGLLREESLEGMDQILAEKQEVIAEIQRHEAEAAPLWPQLETADAAPEARRGLDEEMARRKEMVERIQVKEAAISESLAQRSEQIRQSLGTLRKGGQAMDAYRPTRTYSPRFIDKRE